MHQTWLCQDMSLFVLDSLPKSSYSRAAYTGWITGIIENQKTALGFWLLAFGQPKTNKWGAMA